MDAGQKPDKPHQELDLSSFVSGLTHEIANPLNAIAMNCDLLRLVVDRGDLARVREIAERLQASSTRGATLVRGLQAFGSALRRNPVESVPAAVIFESAFRAATNGRAESPPQFQVEGGSVVLHVDRAALERGRHDVAATRQSSRSASEKSEHPERALRDEQDSGLGVRSERHLRKGHRRHFQIDAGGPRRRAAG